MKFKRNDLITIKLPEPTRIGPTGIKIFVDHKGVPWAFDLFENEIGQVFEVVSCKDGYVTYKRLNQIGKLHSGFPYAPIAFITTNE